MAKTKKVLTTGLVTIGSTTYAVTNMKVSRSLSKIDVTDTASAGNTKEYLPGREEATFSFDTFMGVNEDDISTGAIAALELSFEGKKYAGAVIMEKMDADGSIDAAITQSYSGTFTGAVTVTKVT